MYIYIDIDDYMYIKYVYTHIRRKFRSQTSDNMDRWKAETGRVREIRRVEERRSEKRKSQKKEDADARKGRKVAKHCGFPMICGSGGSKSRLAKAAGAEPAGEVRDEKFEKLHAVVAQSTFRSQNVEETPQLRSAFRSCDVEQVHAAVARSTFRSQNVQTTPRSDHFWKLICRKSARRCGAKHISKSKCTKHLSVGPLLEVEMSKKCTLLRREAHVEVKSAKNWRVRSTFGHSDVLSRGKRKGLCTLAKVSSTFHLWRKSRRIALFLTLLSSKLRRSAELLRFWTLLGWKIKEVSQNWSVFDVVKFEKWGSLAEELRLESGR